MTIEYGGTSWKLKAIDDESRGNVRHLMMYPQETFGRLSRRILGPPRMIVDSIVAHDGTRHLMSNLAVAPMPAKSLAKPRLRIPSIVAVIQQSNLTPVSA